MIYDVAIHGIHAILHRISSAATVCIGTDKIHWSAIIVFCTGCSVVQVFALVGYRVCTTDRTVTV